MKLIAQLHLKPTPHQALLLKATLERANAACNTISEQAWEHQTVGHYDLQPALQATLRSETQLAAQVVVRCISKVADAYTLERSTQRRFKEQGAMAYDSRILKYRTDQQIASIWTLPGREPMPYVCGQRQAEWMNHPHGESDLVYPRAKWYLLATGEIDDPTPEERAGWLGVDRGVVNLATDSEGNL